MICSILEELTIDRGYVGLYQCLNENNPEAGFKIYKKRGAYHKISEAEFFILSTHNQSFVASCVNASGSDKGTLNNFWVNLLAPETR